MDMVAGDAARVLAAVPESRMSRRLPYRTHPPAGDVVPVEVAQRLAKERDALLAQLERTEGLVRTLRHRLAVREEENAQLAQAVESLRAPRAAPPSQQLAERLRRQVRELTEERDRAIASRDAALAERDSLQAALARAEAQIEALSAEHPDVGRVQRLAADLANLRRRRDQDVADGVRRERVAILREVGALYDALLRAIAHDDGASDPWRDGVRQVVRSFERFFDKAGVRVVGAVGERFDPEVHEAVATAPAGEEFGVADTVVEVVRRGLVLDDGTVIVPAQVVVSR